MRFKASSLSQHTFGHCLLTHNLVLKQKDEMMKLPVSSDLGSEWCRHRSALSAPAPPGTACQAGRQLRCTASREPGRPENILELKICQNGKYFRAENSGEVS